jgi:hypothetical protein
MSRKIWSAVAVIVGVALLVVATLYIIAGVKHPSANKSITIALLSAIGAPVAVSLIVAGCSGLRGPNSSDLRTEAEAKKRAAAALEDAETAEQIKAELNAYVALRSQVLEVERRRHELSNSSATLVEEARELNEREARLGVELTRLSPTTVETLDALMEPDPRFVMPQIFLLGGIGGPASVLAAKIVEFAVNTSLNYLDRKRIQQMASLAPDALLDHDRDGSYDSTDPPPGDKHV